MINSRSFRQRQSKEAARQNGRPTTHSEIMRRRGVNRSLHAPGDIQVYKGGTRVPINDNEHYRVYSFNMPGSNGSGEYKITSGNQTLIVLSGVLFVTRATKNDSQNITLRTDDSITFKKGDIVSYCPNNSFMNGILIESKGIKLKKNTDPIVNSTGAEVFKSTRAERRHLSNNLPRRRVKSDAERRAFGEAYMAARGVEKQGISTPTNAAGIPTRTNGIPEQATIDTVATNVETVNPQPMGDKE